MSNWNNDLNKTNGAYDIWFGKLMMRVRYSLPRDVIDPTIEAAAIFVGFYRFGEAKTLEQTGKELAENTWWHKS